MRALIVLAMFLGMALATPEATRAQDIRGNVNSGRALARAWCAECHRVEKGRTRTFIYSTDLTEVANLPSTTPLSLRVFLRSYHQEMPNFILKPAEADDIIAYILSLKRK
jgi:mono/diheme cytochrome c family protein